jgi:hypothetical protein
VWVAAHPPVVYPLVADITRIGYLSPECVGARWTTSLTGRVGSRFTGTNRVGDSVWSMDCEVVTADPPNAFAWRVLTESVTSDTSVWTFLFAADTGGTLVTESFSMAEPPTGLQNLLDRHDPPEQQQLIEWRRLRLTSGILATLANLKQVAESKDA